MNLIKNTILILVLIPLFLTSSCKNNKDNVNPVPASTQIEFSFEHSVGSKELNFNSIEYTNAFGNNYSVETLKYFVSDITLMKDDGTVVLIDEEHYVDAKDENTLLFKPETKIPTGEYLSISFIFGLSEEKNVNGMFPNPPESNMEWPMAMGPGYHYMKLEGKYDSTDVIKNYQAHTGATNGNQNFITLDFTNSVFTTSTNGTHIVINMNINNWWVHPNTLDLNNMTMIMGNQEMQVKLHDNGKEDVFTIDIIQ